MVAFRFAERVETMKVPGRRGDIPGMGWSLLGRAGLAMAGGVVGVAAGLISGCRNGPCLQTEQYVTRDGQEQQIGSACTGFEKDSGFGAGLLPGVPGAAGDGNVDETNGYAFKYEGT